MFWFSRYMFDIFSHLLFTKDGVVPAGLIVDYNTPGMKELETLGNDIEKLKLFVY